MRTPLPRALGDVGPVHLKHDYFINLGYNMLQQLSKTTFMTAEKKGALENQSNKLTLSRNQTGITGGREVHQLTTLSLITPQTHYPYMTT